MGWATYVLLTLTYTLIAIPYVSLISVITDDPQERLSANGYRFVMTKIAMVRRNNYCSFICNVSWEE